MKKLFLILLTLSIHLTGCAPSINCYMLVEETPTAKPVDAPVAVIVNADTECPYEELGILSASSGVYGGGRDAFVEAMKKRAREIGGDAILLGNVTSHTSVDISESTPNATTNEYQRGVVIRFEDPDCVK